jgi:nucleoside-diphosphate-sugar epimerase
MPKVVYVTGCLGFIGSYVTRTCLERGWHVFGIDKCTYASNLENLKDYRDWMNSK